jgi:uncharacterized protein
LAEINILEQTRKLVELQKVDAQIYELRKTLKEKPAVLAELNTNFEGKKAGLKALEEKFKTMQVERKSLEGELKAQEDNIAKSNTQLSQIKTNREYTAKITEIENIKADKSVLEEKIITAFDKADVVKADMEREKTALAKEEQDFLKQKKEIEDAIKIIQDKIKMLDDQRSQIFPQVDKNVLSRYEKILVNKEGLAIVPVSGVSCGGCFMNVPAQVINEMKMHQQMIHCEMCARILYLEEDIK